MTSKVSQNGPAFFDLMSCASSPRRLRTSDRRHFDRKQRSWRFGNEHVIEVKFVHRPAVDLRRSKGKGHPADQSMPLRDRIVDRHVRQGGRDRMRELL